MDKRNKHVLINLTEDQYNQLLFIAEKERRKLADMAFIILTDSIDSLITKATDIKSSGFDKLKYID